MQKISVIQMNSRENKDANIDRAEELVRAAWGADGADYILTPEHTTVLSGDAAHMRAAAEDLDTGAGLRRFAVLAADLKTTIHLGSAITVQNGRYRNTSIVFGPDGTRLAVYHKIHRFDIDLPNGVSYRESDTVDAGDAVVAFQHGNLTVGCTVCYDIRFPALYGALATRGADVITLPAAFTFTTGAAHWDTLLRARAIETQCYVAAAGQVGSFPAPDGARQTYGNSQIIDPWGTVLARCADGEGWATATLDPAYQGKVRANMPVASHKRPLQ